MHTQDHFDVIIIGGSYAGLSAAMALGRALRRVLVIDGGQPCNRQTPYSHNFITHDGAAPASIAERAREQVLRYATVIFREDLAISGIRRERGFEIGTRSGRVYYADKLIFASGVRDLMPDIGGFAACWGISVIHCPYCHGYEVRNTPTGILAGGDAAMHMARLILNWTKDLTVFSNGSSGLTEEQTLKLQQHGISLVEKPVDRLQHRHGRLEHIVFSDGSVTALNALYARPAFEQHCGIPEALGCSLTEHGYIRVSDSQKTDVAGIYACGDSTSMMRSVANAVASGNIAGATVNHELIEESF